MTPVSPTLESFTWLSAHLRALSFTEPALRLKPDQIDTLAVLLLEEEEAVVKSDGTSIPISCGGIWSHYLAFQRRWGRKLFEDDIDLSFAFIGKDEPFPEPLPPANPSPFITYSEFACRMPNTRVGIVERMSKKGQFPPFVRMAPRSERLWSREAVDRWFEGKTAHMRDA